MEQHSMSNFIKALSTFSSSISMSFQPLMHWGLNHGGLNHDLSAAPLWDSKPAYDFADLKFFLNLVRDELLINPGATL